MSRRAFAVIAGSLVTAALAASLLPSCTSETIVLASLPASDGGGAGPPRRCATSDDCPGGWFCDKHDCDDSAGQCAPAPAFCDADEKPVCGCDGVTYFNDCLRRAAGQPAAIYGECGANARTCSASSPDDCPEGTTCALLMGLYGACGGEVRGTCWLLPATCSSDARTLPDRWDSCSGPGRCLETCAALRAGGVYVRSSACP